ncbi:hypothetical protein [Nostoc sp.]|uniref:hypothetical protein n=1 Tax=Nostoc sp. TaxID=1180 RepID=UPI00359469B8
MSYLVNSVVIIVDFLRSPANARRLLDAIEESKTGKIQSDHIVFRVSNAHLWAIESTS